MFLVFEDHGLNPLKIEEAIEVFSNEEEADYFCNHHPYTFYLHENEIRHFNENNHYSMETIESLNEEYLEERRDTEETQFFNESFADLPF